MKRIKDPIYGYIELTEDICRNFVDTAEFQRLRRIVQTSYGPLFPSALHNRFVHSLGVYFLGLHVAKTLDGCVAQLFPRSDEPGGSEENDELRDHWAESLETYKLACLLHDFGHSPFSHSGEAFFVSSGESLNADLIAIVDDKVFEEEVGQLTKANWAAEHEIMSAILSLERFGEIIPNHSLFARAITGYQFGADDKPAAQLDNILIRALNSDIIDVDRMDYLIRDSYVVGFDSVSIDYERLLDGLRIVQVTRNMLDLAYHKSAISVLENTIYARDFEKKWVQAHPAVLYDQFLVQHCIRKINQEFMRDNDVALFSKRALTAEGVSFGSDRCIRLISDDDVMFLAKNEYRDSFVDEYFCRSKRRHPIWKSEAEYYSLFHMDKKHDAAVADLERMLHELEDGLNNQGMDAVLNDEAIDVLRKEKDSVNSKDLREGARKAEIDEDLRFLELLKEFSEKRNLVFDYALVGFKSFNSGFRGGSIENAKVVFSNEANAHAYTLVDVSRPLSFQGDIDQLFYLYHKDAGGEFPKDDLVTFLLTYNDPSGK